MPAERCSAAQHRKFRQHPLFMRSMLLARP
jgi:hypothetical protein